MNDGQPFLSFQENPHNNGDGSLYHRIRSTEHHPFQERRAFLVCQRYGLRACVHIYCSQQRSIETLIGYAPVRLGSGDPRGLATAQCTANQVAEYGAIRRPTCFEC